jgi:hypothetical protein
MNVEEEFKIESLPLAERFDCLGWIIFRIELGESGNLLEGEIGIATIPKYVCHLTTLGQKHIVEIKPFITNYLELQASNVIQ